MSATVFSKTLTKCLHRLHHLQDKGFPFGQFLQHLGNLIMATADEYLSVDRLDHVAHVDDLDLMNNTAFSYSLKRKQMIIR